MKTRELLILVCLFTFLTGCVTTESLDSGSTRFLPPELAHVSFGQPQADFLQQYPQAMEDHEDGMAFRRIFLRDDVGEAFDSVAYYFDADGDKPLYEVILNYKDPAVRDAWVSSQLGPPNFKDSEWLFDSGEGYSLNAWTFQNKLIFAAILPGTEWDEDGDGEVDS